MYKGIPFNEIFNDFYMILFDRKIEWPGTMLGGKVDIRSRFIKHV